MATSSNSPNPYDSPAYSAYSHERFGPVPRSAPALPVFCIVVFVLDLLFSLLRMFLAGFGVLGLQMGGHDPMVMQTGIFEVATGASMALFGLLADAAMLLKQRWGAMLAWLKALAALASIAVGFWQLTFVIEQFPADSPQRIGAVVGGTFVGFLRLALLGLYAAAVVAFVKSREQRASSAWPTGSQR